MAKKIKKTLQNNCLELCNQIYQNNLSVNSFGNASVYDDEEKLIYIKPSGLNINNLTNKSISVVDTENDKVISGLKPSVDYHFHKSIYKSNFGYNSIIHTHSTYATILAQLDIPPYCIGTTHADYTLSDIPITRELKINNKYSNYENELSSSIIETLKRQHNNFPFILIKDHGSLSFGVTSKETIDRSIALEFISKIFYLSTLSNKNKLKKNIKTKKVFKYHYNRKNSSKKFYGQ